RRRLMRSGIVWSRRLEPAATGRAASPARQEVAAPRHEEEDRGGCAGGDGGPEGPFCPLQRAAARPRGGPPHQRPRPGRAGAGAGTATAPGRRLRTDGFTAAATGVGFRPALTFIGAGAMTRSRNCGNVFSGSNGPVLVRDARTLLASPSRPSLSERRIAAV